jgi:glycosyltransferase XagB
LIVSRSHILSFPTAKDGASRLQKYCLAAALVAIIALLFLVRAPLALLALLFSPIFLSVLVLQLGMSIDSLSAERKSEDENTVFQDRDWPLYTLLIPLLDEDEIIDQLCDAIASLDYPKDKLEVFFLLEERDKKTRAALLKQLRPNSMKMITVPPGSPKTKPRALNYALDFAQGTYVSVYDAEDIPDPGQLKQAVLLFEASPPETLCLQAHLVIDNASDSWFAKMMMIEYAALFEIIKPGLSRSEFPVALGGTSNHFRRQTLEHFGGWDAYNVTEDADMGFRIARIGGRVLDLASETREEAPVFFKDWLGQRRRWLKGWIQTGIAHSRNPRRTIQQMGFTNWLIAMTQVIGIIFSTLLYPIFAGWLVLTIWDRTLFQASDWIDIVQNSIAIVIFLAGLIAVLLPAFLGLRRRKLQHYAPWLLTLPIYQLLIFYAACCAVTDLLLNPFHWEKTRHGKGKRGL